MADLQQLRQLLGAEQGLVVLATTRPDHSVHASVVNAGLLADPVTATPVLGMVVRGEARKLDYLRATGSATATVRVGWQWASVEGPVRIAGPEDPLADFDQERLPQLLRDIFTAAGGTHDDWAHYDQTMAAEHRAAILLTPRRVLGNRA